MTELLIDVAAFDGLSPQAATELLRPVCASSGWLRAMVAARPYGSAAELTACSDGVVAALGWPDVEEALAAHPRIGDRATGDSRESRWSREEQAGAGPSDPLRAANLEYEQRFGHVFLICASGRSSEEILAALHDRLDNDVATEQDAVRRELAAIVRLRLKKTIG